MVMVAGFVQLGAFMLVLYLNEYLSYQWLIISAIVNGVCGSIPIFMAVFLSYISDCTPSGSRYVEYFHPVLSSSCFKQKFTSSEHTIFPYFLVVYLVGWD